MGENYGVARVTISIPRDRMESVGSPEQLVKNELDRIFNSRGTSRYDVLRVNSIGDSTLENMYEVTISISVPDDELKSWDEARTNIENKILSIEDDFNSENGAFSIEGVEPVVDDYGRTSIAFVKSGSG